ncbi:MAG: hypothetical protein FWD39_01645 [Clostridiales bacterium]|nr:hypothetical protein [Clostridiales bacterium]
MAFDNNKGAGAGGSSVLMVFMVLCLCIFGTLSLLSAHADLTISNKTAVAAEQFYRADAEAERFLAVIDACFFAARQETEAILTAGDYTQEALERLGPQGQDFLRSLTKPAGIEDADEIYHHFAAAYLARLEGVMVTRVEASETVISFRVEINNTRALSVKIRMNAFSVPLRYGVLEWKAVDETPWEIDEGGNIPVG